MTWTLRFLVLFFITSQQGIIIGGGTPEAKHIQKTLLQEYDFSPNFLAQEIF
jgi:hypothetical protein